MVPMLFVNLASLMYLSAAKFEVASILLFGFFFTSNLIAADDAELLFVRRVQPLLNEKMHGLPW